MTKPDGAGPTEEDFKPVPGTNGLYEVSNRGRIKSNVYWKGFEPGKILSVCKNVCGYPTVRLLGKTRTVHSIVLETFVGPRPTGHEINHINSIRHDNRLENLEYTTTSGNQLHSYRNGRVNGNRKLKESDYKKIFLLKKKGVYYKKIAEKYGIYPTTIFKFIKRERMPNGEMRWILKNPYQESERLMKEETK